jgi:uncharacterized protein (DUF342 family)
MEGATATIIAASIGAGVALLIAFVGVNARIFTRLGRLEQGFELLRDDYKELREDNRRLREELREEMRENNRQLREEMRENNRQLREEMRDSNQQLRELIRSESEATRAEIRRLADALVSHHHEADGSIVFRIPPPQDAGD